MGCYGIDGLGFFCFVLGTEPRPKDEIIRSKVSA